jgi:hypothetical protein
MKLFGWMVRGLNPGSGETFSIRPERLWGPPSLVYNGYRVLPGGKAAGAWHWPTTHLVPWRVLGWPLLFYGMRNIFVPMTPHVSYGLRGLPSRLWPKCNRLLRLGLSYVVSRRWMVIYEYEVTAGALNPSSTKLPIRWSRWESSPSRKNLHGGTGNRSRDLMISSQKLWPLDYEAGCMWNVER